MTVNKNQTIYVDSACPTCHRHQEASGLPVYVLVGVLFLVLILLAYLYVRMLLAEQAVADCRYFTGRGEENTPPPPPPPALPRGRTSNSRRRGSRKKFTRG